jgi:hypothetical protein
MERITAEELKALGEVMRDLGIVSLKSESLQIEMLPSRSRKEAGNASQDDDDGVEPARDLTFAHTEGF